MLPPPPLPPGAALPSSPLSPAGHAVSTNMTTMNGAISRNLDIRFLHLCEIAWLGHESLVCALGTIDADARQPDAEVERSPAFSSYGCCFSQVQTSQSQLTSVFSDSGSKIWSLSIGTAS